MTGPALAELDGRDYDHGADLSTPKEEQDPDTDQLRLIPLVLLDALVAEARQMHAVQVAWGNGENWHTDYPGMSRLIHLTDL